MTMHLIEWEGKQLAVENPDGYPGHTLIASDIPPKPWWDHDIEWTGEGWELPLPVRQSRLWEKVKALRTEKEQGVAPTPVGPVQIDEQSKTKINGILSMARLKEELGQGFAEPFTMADNSVVTLDNTSVRQVAAAAAQYVSQVYAHARALRAQIYAENANLDEIDVEAGWP